MGDWEPQAVKSVVIVRFFNKSPAGDLSEWWSNLIVKIPPLGFVFATTDGGAFLDVKLLWWSRCHRILDRWSTLPSVPARCLLLWSLVTPTVSLRWRAFGRLPTTCRFFIFILCHRFRGMPNLDEFLRREGAAFLKFHQLEFN